jgi:transcriptional regulator with XRE-family HTH domain
MIHAAQIRAARALLGWRQEDLAKAAKSGLATVARIEQREGPAQGHSSTIMRIEAALMRAGVRFFEDEDGSFGVRLIKRAKKA